MINLLPPKEREMLFAEQIKKLATILGIVILSALVCLLFVLLSVYFFALGEIKSQDFLLKEAAQNYQSPNSIMLKAVVQKYNKILPQIYSFYSDQKHFSDAIGVIYSVPKPNGLAFLNLSIDATKQGLGKNELFVSITGTSATRDNLIEYQNNLTRENKIKNVSFSPESWINSKNINFSLTFNLTDNGSQK